MCHDNFGDAMREMAREIKEGVRAFARAMEEEGVRDGWRCGPDFDGSFRFRHEFGGQPRYCTFKREDGALVFQFLLPGFDESDVELKFQGDRMILKATLPESLRGDRPPELASFLRDIEKREYRVPAASYDQAATKAVFKNCVLTVTVPSKEAADSPAVKVEIVTDAN